MAETLSAWTIYKSPSDFPGCVMARKSLIGSGTVTPTEDTILPPIAGDPSDYRDEARMGEELLFVRAEIQCRMPEAVPFCRFEHDDPVIVETWI